MKTSGIFKPARLFKPALVTLAISMTVQPAFGETLLEIYHKAIENDHEFQAARANLNAGMESRTIGRAALLPQLGAEASYNRNQIDDNRPVAIGDPLNPVDPTGGFVGDYDLTSKTYGVSLRQPLIDFGAWHRFQQGKALASEAEAAFTDEAQNLILRTTNAYFSVLKAVDNLTTANAEAEALSQQLEQSRQRFEVGLTAITEVHEAQAAYDSANANRLVAEGNVGIAFEALGVLTGENYTTLAPLRNELPVSPPEPADRKHWEEMALANNAQLKAAEFRTEAAEATADISRSEHYPQLYGSVSRSTRDIEIDSGGGDTFQQADDTTTAFGVTLSVPLFSGGGISASRRQAYNQFLSTRELYLKARRDVVQAARVSFLDVITSAATVKAREQAIVSGRSALEATQAGYDVGTRDLVDVLNAQRNLFSAQRDYYDALYTYIVSRMQLNKAAGVLAEEDIVQLNQLLDPERTVQYTPQ